MSDDSNQTDGELFDTEKSEGDADVASTTEKDQETESEKGEETEETLDLDDDVEDKKPKEEKKVSAKENKEKQIATWLRRVESGEKELDEIPHKWIRTAVEKQMKVEIDLDKIVDEKLAAKEDEKTFNALREKLNGIDLTSSEKKEVSAEFKELRKMGASKAKALAKAIQIAGIEMGDTKKKKEAMKLPKSGEYRKEKDKKAKITDDMEYKDIYEKVPEEERIKYLKSQTDEESGIIPLSNK